ncbi:peptidylprolyl isomerase [Candidatus Microgenomates bacterium]|nr:peptidylprolyl isomerase [Candidatus Microgenomates bacterium]
MFTNEKLLVILIFLLIFGGASYFAFTKFKQEVGISSSPSPTPSPTLNFILTRTPPPTPPQAQQPQQQPQPNELPLAKNKRLVGFPGILSTDVLQNKKAIISTAKGKIELEIYPEATKSASNFILLAANGFYDGLTFHRVEPGLLIQGGDPVGNGTGGAGYIFEDEPIMREYKRGTVAMANAGPNTNSSQFFIVISDNPNIPKKYTIFATVIFGMEVVEKISVGDIMQKVIIQNLK